MLRKSRCAAYSMADVAGPGSPSRRTRRGRPGRTSPWPSSPPMGVRSKRPTSSRMALETVRTARRGTVACSAARSSVAVHSPRPISSTYHRAAGQLKTRLTQRSCQAQRGLGPGGSKKAMERRGAPDAILEARRLQPDGQGLDLSRPEPAELAPALGLAQAEAQPFLAQAEGAMRTPAPQLRQIANQGVAPLPHSTRARGRYCLGPSRAPP
jgi:hypothetical protein